MLEIDVVWFSVGYVIEKDTGVTPVPPDKK
jgi:hypothetical protein